MSDEVRVTSETGGEKGQKLARIGSLDPQALLTVAAVAGFGENKYARLNYMNGFDWSLSFDAAQRHLLLFWDGQDFDEESGLPHLAHAAWQCLALLAFMQRQIGTDNRYRAEPVEEPQEGDTEDEYEWGWADIPSFGPPLVWASLSEASARMSAACSVSGRPTRIYRRAKGASASKWEEVG